MLFLPRNPMILANIVKNCQKQLFLTAFFNTFLPWRIQNCHKQLFLTLSSHKNEANFYNFTFKVIQGYNYLTQELPHAKVNIFQIIPIYLVSCDKPFKRCHRGWRGLEDWKIGGSEDWRVFRFPYSEIRVPWSGANQESIFDNFLKTQRLKTTKKRKNTIITSHATKQMTFRYWNSNKWHFPFSMGMSLNGRAQRSFRKGFSKKNLKWPP